MKLLALFFIALVVLLVGCTAEVEDQSMDDQDDMMDAESSEGSVSDAVEEDVDFGEVY